MRYKIYFELIDGKFDDITISGDTIEAIREQANAEVEKRGTIDYWSEAV